MLTDSSSVPAFKVTGPSELLELVRTQLEASRRAGIMYETSETLEVRVLADQTVIETQLSAWSERLKQARR